MESIVCLILGICFIILSVFVTGACWIVFLDTKFKTLNKRMVIISIILWILCPIGLPILIIIAIISEFMDIIKITKIIIHENNSTLCSRTEF